MRSLVFGAVLFAACSSDAPGMLTLVPDSTQIAVGGTTYVQAFLITNGSDGDNPPIAASWSTDPSGIVTLTANNNIQTVVGVVPGDVVVTAKADDQTAMVGFTVSSP